MRCCLTLALALLAGVAQGAQHLTLGVLAVRPAPVVQAQYQPLADYLSEQLGDTTVQLEVLTHDRMQQALAQHQVDLVLTNPGSYLLLRRRSSLSSVLATLRGVHDDKATTHQGGVIIVRAGRSDIRALTDLRGRRVAVLGQWALGGFQAPMRELINAGLKMPPLSLSVSPDTDRTGGRRGNSIRMEIVDTYDAVVTAVLEGSADAGFVRTGILESLVDERRLDAARLAVINQQALADFPFPVSTPLYPEWPLVAMPQVDQDTARQLTAAALRLDATHPAARAAGIAGFSPPADYVAVEELLRTLRLPPYDQPVALTWHTLWERHWPTLLALGIAGASVLALLALAISRNRALKRSGETLAALVAQQRALLTAMPFPVFEIDTNGLVQRVWASSDMKTSIDPHHMVGHKVDQLVPPEVAEHVMGALQQAAECGLVRGVEIALEGPTGTRQVDLSVSAVTSANTTPRFLVLARDVTVERENQRWLNIAASVFTFAGEGVLIAAPDSRILAVNKAFLRIIGYPDDAEVVGRYTHELSIDYLGGESLDSLRRSLDEHGHWHGELCGRRDDGSTYTATLSVNTAHDADGQGAHRIAVLTDISQLKAQQAQLERIAYHDVLTGLPNRALFADRLQQAMAHTGRLETQLAVAYIDLDGFKAINDSHGHAFGDRLLISIAERMKEAIREGDTLARLGGDEFVAVLTGLQQDTDCRPMIERLLAAAAAPVVMDDRVLHVTASIGVALYPQPEALSADQLLRHADHAMYEAKQTGKNRYHVHVPDDAQPTPQILQQAGNVTPYRHTTRGPHTPMTPPHNPQ